MRSSSERARGFTLIEVLVYSSVLAFLLGGLYLLVVAGSKHFQKGRAYQTAQQEALKGMTALSRELKNAKANSVLHTPLPTPNILFLSPEEPAPASAGSREYDSAGQLLWKKWACFYRDTAESTLVRREESITPVALSVSDLPPLPPGDVLYFQTLAGVQSRVVARQIVNLSFADEAGGSILVQLSASEAVSSDASTTVNLRSLVRLMN